MSSRIIRRCLTLALSVATACHAGQSLAHSPNVPSRRHLADREPDQRLNVEEEAFVHTPTGFERAGEPVRVRRQDAETATLRVTIVDASSNTPTACRVNVVGPDGNFYEPTEHSLSAWSRQRTAESETHGPSRYYGWYFYTLGHFEVVVPAGKVRVQANKGYEFQPIEELVTLAPGQTRELRMELERTVPMQNYAYYSGDTHIHLNRHHDEDDERALDLMEAEDIEYGYLLCMNDPSSYSGAMPRQEWQQRQGLGTRSVRTRGRYGIASGQEYRADTYGHISLLMHDRLVLDGMTVDPSRWPVFDYIGRETRRLGGVSFHAHGGYSAEIYADYIQQSTDGVELLQMAHYRGIGLSGWYRILNCGFRFPALAGSDFPYCRCLGDCRNYVYADAKPDFAGWARGAAEGRSFFTTGPMLLLDVDGRRPGDTIALTAGGNSKLAVRIRMRSEVTPVQRVELIVGGQTIHSMKIPDHSARGHWHELQHELDVQQPCWIAARAFSLSATGRPDAEAHTNPVYVYVDGQQPFNESDQKWLLAKLDGRIAALHKRQFPEKQRVVEFFLATRRKLLER